MSVAEDFIDDMITEMADGSRCTECGYPIYEAPGCQCEHPAPPAEQEAQR